MDGGLASYGSATVAQTNRPIDCYAVTESRFRRQLFHERAQASLGSAGLQRAAELLANIRNTTIAMVKYETPCSPYTVSLALPSLSMLAP